MKQDELPLGVERGCQPTGGTIGDAGSPKYGGAAAIEFMR